MKRFIMGLHQRWCICLILILCAIVPVAGAVEEYGPVASWGSPGIGYGEFSSPNGIAVDGAGSIYVADTDNTRVQKFVWHVDNYAFAQAWGTPGTGDGQFGLTTGITVDRDGTVVYVVDAGNNRVTAFTADGDFVTSWGSEGTGEGQFSRPRGIASSGDLVYVADTRNDRIQVFRPDGTFVAQWGSTGSGDGQFAGPRGVAVDRADNVYVADTDNNRVQKFGPDGVFIGALGGPGAGTGQFAQPSSVAVDRAGNVYVADMNNQRIQKFTSSGAFLTSWGSAGAREGEFSSPMGVAVDDGPYVYVADTRNHRVQVFATPPVASFTCTEYRDPATGNHTVSCVDTSSGPVDTRAWDFGDGTRSSNLSVVHSYNDPGSYELSLTVTNRLTSDQATRAITVPPTVVIPLPDMAHEPTDWDRDGLYEDVNGNGRSDFADVVLYIEQYEWIAANEPFAAFNYDGDDRIYWGDMVWLYNHLSLLPWPRPTVVPITPASISTGTFTISRVGDTVQVPIALDTAPGGLAGFNITVALSDPSVAEITAVTFPPEVNQSLISQTDLTIPASTVVLSAVVLHVPPGGTDVVLATLTVRGTASGVAEIEITPEPFLGVADLAGDLYAISAHPGTVTVLAPTTTEPTTIATSPTTVATSPTTVGTSPTPSAPAVVPFPGMAALPADLDGDARCEDINGNGRTDFADVVLYFNQMSWIGANEPVLAFDYNGNGRVDFADVNWLFSNL